MNIACTLTFQPLPSVSTFETSYVNISNYWFLICPFAKQQMLTYLEQSFPISIHAYSPWECSCFLCSKFSILVQRPKVWKDFTHTYKRYDVGQPHTSWRSHALPLLLMPQLPPFWGRTEQGVSCGSKCTPI